MPVFTSKCSRRVQACLSETVGIRGNCSQLSPTPLCMQLNRCTCQSSWTDLQLSPTLTMSKEEQLCWTKPVQSSIFSRLMLLDMLWSAASCELQGKVSRYATMLPLEQILDTALYSYGKAIQCGGYIEVAKTSTHFRFVAYNSMQTLPGVCA